MAIQKENNYAALRLKNQLCFPLYAVSNLITRKYKPLLDRLELTYTQYLVMLVMWERERANEKLLCNTLCLKSNTLTPLLKKLQEKGYIQKEKDKTDERNLLLTLTPAGRALQEEALCVPGCIAREFPLTPDEAQTLYHVLYKILDQQKEETP